MNIDDFKKKLLAPILWGNLLAMVLVTVAICFGLWMWMNDYTRHGEKISVPNVVGQFEASAVYQLETLGLEAVVADSGYNRQLPPGTILEQLPAAGSEVKSGRSIYLTVNSTSAPMLVMPDIADNCSMREAEARLSALGFKLSPAEFVPGDKDWVIAVKCHGRNVVRGERLPAETYVTLVVGSGTAEDLDSLAAEEEEEEEVLLTEPLNP
ncbi:MAG: PASTA domain-containing protein [Bacteroidaceae bacterium]|nr:PASTA domain-containing protein [Bacteroidaceae bacterium]